MIKFEGNIKKKNELKTKISLYLLPTVVVLLLVSSVTLVFIAPTTVSATTSTSDSNSVSASDSIFTHTLTESVSSATPDGETHTVSGGDSIQDAVDKASPGDRIEVEPGIYEESVTIDVKGIELVSVERREAQISPLMGPAIVIEADDISVEGFTISEEDSNGIHVEEVDGAKILDNEIRNGISYAIKLVGTSEDLIENNTLKQNEDGFVGEDVSSVTISGNEFFSNEDVAIKVDEGSTDVMIENNKISESRDGIFVDDSTQINITDNEIESNENSGLFVENSGDGDVGITIEENLIQNNNIEGIHLSRVSGVTINGNEIVGNGRGIDLSRVSEISIEKNEIQANFYGIYIMGANEGISIHYNNIFENFMGVEHSTGKMVDATSNYWGASDGPSGEWIGGGDPVSDNVEFIPYLDDRHPEGEEVFPDTLFLKIEGPISVEVGESATYTVVDQNDEPVEGATVTTDDMEETTDASGEVTFTFDEAGEYTVTADKDDYDEATMTTTVQRIEESISLSISVETVEDDRMEEEPITFKVTAAGEPVEDATISAAGMEATTGSDGTATLTFEEAGDYSVTATKADETTDRKEISYSSDSVEVTVMRAPGLTAVIAITAMLGAALILLRRRARA